MLFVNMRRNLPEAIPPPQAAIQWTQAVPTDRESVTRSNAHPPHRVRKTTKHSIVRICSRLRHTRQPAITRPVHTSNLAAAHRAALLKLKIAAMDRPGGKTPPLYSS
jgi:hypothetical protein